jgi:hypothetical protein
VEKKSGLVVAMAVCESCYLVDHVRWQPESMDNTGSVMMRLVGVDVPIKINSGSVEVCCMCGGITISGIYEFKDPSDVLFDDDGTDKFEIELPQFDLGDDLD